MKLTYEQLQRLQKTHFEKLTVLLDGQAFASSWSHSGQIVRYLEHKLTPQNLAIKIAPEAWNLHAAEAVNEIMNGQDFPLDAFKEFLQHPEQEKFLLPIMLRHNHFAGLCIEKQYPASEGSSNAKILLQLSYVDPKADAEDGAGSSTRDLAAIANKLPQILASYEENITSRHKIIPSNILSHNFWTDEILS